MSLTESEFTSLRRTITVRGTVRMALLPVTLLGWAIVALLLLLFGELPAAVVFPLAVLVGGFEAIHALHVGAERIGRYLQVYYEMLPPALSLPSMPPRFLWIRLRSPERATAVSPSPRTAFFAEK
jgi:hypothetical protein